MASVYYEKNHDIVGSWYPTSFHGHFRNRPRTEYHIPYRQRAKPSPPQKFLDHCKERTNEHLFSQHDNRYAHSDKGNLESYFGMGLGKRRSVNSHHNKNTQELLMWSKKTTDPLISTYRSQYSRTPQPPKEAGNSIEPLHVRGNTTIQRRQLRAHSTPPRCHTASLLAWNTTEEFLHVKPLVGSRTNHFADQFARQKSTHTRAPFSSTSAIPSSESLVSETITAFNAKV